MPFDWRHRKKLADIQRATSFQSGTGTLQEGGVDEEESGCELGAHPTARVDSMPQLSYDFFLITRNQNSDGGNEMGPPILIGQQTANVGIWVTYGTTTSPNPRHRLRRIVSVQAQQRKITVGGFKHWLEDSKLRSHGYVPKFKGVNVAAATPH